MKCKLCGNGEMQERDGKYGKFLGCSLYPECKSIEAMKQDETPIMDVTPQVNEAVDELVKAKRPNLSQQQTRNLALEHARETIKIAKIFEQYMENGK